MVTRPGCQSHFVEPCEEPVMVIAVGPAVTTTTSFVALPDPPALSTKSADLYVPGAAYAAPGTYKSALFVDNAGGSGSATKDVVVVTAGPTAITITGSSHGSTKWDWQPGLVTMKVGQPYVI